MRGASLVSTLGVLGTMLFLASATTYAQDSCHEGLTIDGPRQRQDFDSLQIKYASSVFRVLVGPKDSPKFEGNASLIDGNGYFLTAAHVVMNADQGSGGTSPVWVERSLPSGVNTVARFEAQILFQGRPSSTSGAASPDIALLKAIKWVSDGLSRVAPLRYSGDTFNDGIFLAFPDATARLSKYPATRVVVATSDKDGPFKGDAFYGRSGAPIFDQYGLVQGVVAAYNNFAEDEIQSHGGYEPYAEFLDKRQRFGAAVIAPGDAWLQQIPSRNSAVEGIVQNCISGKISRATSRCYATLARCH